MTEDQLRRYAGLIGEFNLEDSFERKEQEELRLFLSRPDITKDTLNARVEAYWHSMENGSSLIESMKNTDYKCTRYVAIYEKHSTILSPQTNTETVRLVRAVRKELKDDRS